MTAPGGRISLLHRIGGGKSRKKKWWSLARDAAASSPPGAAAGRFSRVLQLDGRPGWTHSTSSAKATRDVAGITRKEWTAPSTRLATRHPVQDGHASTTAMRTIRQVSDPDRWVSSSLTAAASGRSSPRSRNGVGEARRKRWWSPTRAAADGSGHVSELMWLPSAMSPSSCYPASFCWLGEQQDRDNPAVGGR